MTCPNSDTSCYLLAMDKTASGSGGDNQERYGAGRDYIRLVHCNYIYC